MGNYVDASIFDISNKFGQLTMYLDVLSFDSIRVENGLYILLLLEGLRKPKVISIEQ